MATLKLRTDEADEERLNYLLETGYELQFQFFEEKTTIYGERKVQWLVFYKPDEGKSKNNTSTQTVTKEDE